jgi:predicted Zn-dependent peptidase
MLSEIRRVRECPPRPAELRRAKEYAIGISRMSLERTTAQNMRVGSSLLIYGGIMEPAEVHERIRAVTPDDVSKAAGRFLDPRHATVAVVGPNPQAGPIEEIFRRAAGPPR